MTAPPPPTLDYQHGDRDPHKSRKFFIALLVGTALSAILWFGAWEPLVNHGSGAAVIVLPSVKAAVAIALLFFRRWRPAALGLLVSIPVGGLIFIGSCFANFRWH